ncbi:c-type cytochrome [Lysobacter yananisis]|uniref:C-type cytochrome n=1 Tax=Lysobacter yananisis TaxID=1003114 RepID=A0ABY9P4M2_9GAMM|nr:MULTISPECIES: c-type cytochrome [Lysobacter]UZW62950.1 c-type cytochrome [Lysobacter enzymogenes]WMT01800.1 c-type cytochrome [Lysobacter yananisis]
MTNPSLLRGLAIASLAFALAACSNPGDAPAGHSSADRNEGHTSSSSGLPAGTAAAGEKLANTKGQATGQSCVDCHGAKGNAPIDGLTPKLAGQYHDYIAHSLQMYRDGDREHSLMSSQAKALNDQQIADLAAYFGSIQEGTTLRDLHGIH